jgi:hypothetical protein
LLKNRFQLYTIYIYSEQFLSAMVQFKSRVTKREVSFKSCVTEREVPDELVIGRRAADALIIREWGMSFWFLSRDPCEYEACAGPTEPRKYIPYCYVFGLCKPG